jgi:hypothetical protein
VYELCGSSICCKIDAWRFGDEDEDDAGRFGDEDEDDAGRFGDEDEDDAGRFGEEDEEDAGRFREEDEEDAGRFREEDEEDAGRFGEENEEDSATGTSDSSANTTLGQLNDETLSNCPKRIGCAIYPRAWPSPLSVILFMLWVFDPATSWRWGLTWSSKATFRMLGIML